MVMGMVVVVVNCNIDGDYVKCDSSSGVGAATLFPLRETFFGEVIKRPARFLG